MKKLSLVLLSLVVLIALYYFYTYFAIAKPSPIQKIIRQQIVTGKTTPPVPYRLEVIAENLYVPWSIVFTSPERILVTERSGNVRVILNGTLQDKPLLTISTLSRQSEEGLMGMTLHPQYAENKYVYLAYAYPKNGGMAVKVVRYTDEDTTLEEDKTILNDIPAAQYHAGTRIKFGPDDKLYITTGDALQRDKAQDITLLNGKILRLNDDGTIPADNPFPDSPIYTYGHRNPQGIDWHPVTHTMFETEHGPSLFDGPAGGDEVNIIKKGHNYGWPVAHHEIHKGGMDDPKIVFTPAVAPASGMFYSGKMFPQFKNTFFFGGLVGEGIWRVTLSDTNPEEVTGYEKLSDVKVGRIRDIAESPDGSIYFTTSNRDGRGNSQAGDDKLYRMVKR